MKFIKQNITDVVLVEPEIIRDERGYFVEIFRNDKIETELGFKINICQENESSSKKGVLRGLHYQLPPFEQSKLVRVIEGKVLDVAVDIRKNSPTYLQHITTILDSTSKKQLFIPRGFAHGFVVLSEQAVYTYKVDNFFSNKNMRGIAFDSKRLNIDWLVPHEELILSSKDRNQPDLPI